MMKKLTAILMALILLLTAASAALAEGDTIYRKGDHGEEVKKIRAKLVELGYLEGEVTEDFDDDMEQAVLWFQRDHWLLVTGMVDPVTREALENETGRGVLRRLCPVRRPRGRGGKEHDGADALCRRTVGNGGVQYG